MRNLSKLKLVLVTIVLSMMTNVAYAQSSTWSAEQTKVWDVVAQSWVDEVAQNGKWPGDYVTDDVKSWGATWPSPRDKKSMDKWSRFGETQTKTIQYENTPVAITIHGDTAIVMYTNVSVSQRGEDKPERSIGGTIETLVKTNDGWKFIALTGFDTTPK